MKSAYKKNDHKRFLHGKEAVKNAAGSMARSRLHRMADMAEELRALLGPEDELPAWVQDHIAVAHEKLASAYSYLEPKAHKR
jgi:hypothetical protein